MERLCTTELLLINLTNTHNKSLFKPKLNIQFPKIIDTLGVYAIAVKLQIIYLLSTDKRKNIFLLGSHPLVKFSLGLQSCFVHKGQVRSTLMVLLISKILLQVGHDSVLFFLDLGRPELSFYI